MFFEFSKRIGLIKVKIHIVTFSNTQVKYLVKIQLIYASITFTITISDNDVYAIMFTWRIKDKRDLQTHYNVTPYEL